MLKNCLVLSVACILAIACSGISPASHPDQGSARGRVAPAAHSVFAVGHDRHCSECGKKILFGSKCASCAVNGAREKAKEIGDKAKDAKRQFNNDRQKREHPCDRCGKTIHAGQFCASCLARIAKEKTSGAVDRAKDMGRRSREKANEAYNRGRERWRETDEQRRRIVEDSRRVASDLRRSSRELLDNREAIAEWVARTRTAAAARYEEAARVYVPTIRRAIADPTNQRRAIDAIGAAVEVHRQVKEAKQQATYRSLKLLSQVPVQTDRGRMSLGELARAKLLEKVPSLEGTDIAEDPVAVSTAFICGDRGYFLTELKVVKSGNQHVSIIEGLRESSSLDASNALQYLAIIEATEDLVNGEEPIDAMVNIAAAIDELNRAAKK